MVQVTRLGNEWLSQLEQCPGKQSSILFSIITPTNRGKWNIGSLAEKDFLPNDTQFPKST